MMYTRKVSLLFFFPGLFPVIVGLVIAVLRLSVFVVVVSSTKVSNHELVTKISLNRQIIIWRTAIRFSRSRCNLKYVIFIMQTLTNSSMLPVCFLLPIVFLVLSFLFFSFLVCVLLRVLLLLSLRHLFWWNEHTVAAKGSTYY